MGDEKVSQFPSAAALSDSDLFPLVQNIPPLSTRQAQLSVLKSYLRSGPTGFDLVYLQQVNQSRTIPGGRLTLVSGQPVPIRDQVGAFIVYYTPYRNNNIFTWNGTSWQRNTFSELSLGVVGLTTGKNYDVFIDQLATTLSLSNPWTDNITRADALGTQDGTTVLGIDHTRLWLGTIRASSPTTTEDSGGGSSSQVGGQRFVWNAYNQVPRFISVIDTTGSWTYSTATIREANNNAGNRVEYVSGADETLINVEIVSTASISGTSAREATVGIGLDSTTTFSGFIGAASNPGASAIEARLSGRFSGFPGMGYHYLSWNESGSDGTCAFIGNQRNTQSGLQAILLN